MVINYYHALNEERLSQCDLNRYSPQFMFGGKEYPDYVSGTGYVISGALVPKLFESAILVPLFHLEDVFVTGMVARRANVVPENFHLFSFVKHPTDNACLYRKVITSHGLSPDELVKVWSHVRNPSVNCTTVQLPKIGDVKLKKCRKVKKVAVAAAVHRGFRRGWWNVRAAVTYISNSVVPLDISP